MQSEVEQIQQLVEAIESCEKTPEIIDWMMQITEKEFDLINSLIQTFLQEFSDIKFANSILRALKKLNDYIPQQVLPQMRENESFPIAISQYIVETKLENLIGEAYLLLIDIFKVSSFKSVTNERFIKTLFDHFEHINDDETFNALVKILINISYETDSIEDNLVLKVVKDHPNQRYFSESLIHITNSGKDEEMNIKCLKFIENIYKVQENFFYANDLKLLIDICVREIQNLSEESLREIYLNVLKILITSKYYQEQTYHHRKDSILQLVDLIQYSTVSNYTREKSESLRQVLENL